MASKVAYSAPFKVLNDKGLRMIRKTIADHDSFVTRNDRMRGGALRGLHYMSKFNEEFLHDPVFLDKISKIAGEPLVPTSFCSHMLHLNFGRVGSANGADAWHFDSVDYVLVIILSDITDMVGGEL